MKKINSTGQTGGAPVNQEDLRTVFNDEIWDAIEALLSPFSADTEGVIVSGCVISGGGPYDISAGIVYLNGEFMRLAAATGQTLPKYIAPATAVNDNRVFADQTTKTLFITKGAELVGSAPGGSQYVAITTTTDPDDRRQRNLMARRALTTSWTQVPLGAAGVYTGTLAPGNEANYSKDEFGFVHLRGRVKATGAGNMLILPAGFIPTLTGGNIAAHPVLIAPADAFASVAKRYMTIDTSGNIVIESQANQDVLFLDGISFYAG